MKDLLDKYKDIIAKTQILSWDSEPTSYRYKSEFVFHDGSKLILKDYLFLKGRKYSFHWQDKDGNMIIRWDNTTHWKDIDTFPHHMHKEGGVHSSQEVALEDVMDHIYHQLINIG